ncbi:wall-associated receptor kinase 2-like [Carex rostrata]
MACPLNKAQFFLYLALTCLIILPTAAVTSASSGCPDKCGNTSIPYPFGTHDGCYREGFHITCNESFTPHKAFLGTNTEVIDISITGGEARIYKYIGFRCYSKENVYYTSFDAQINLVSPYLFSSRRNKFTAIGCDTLAYIVSPPKQSDISKPYLSGCVSFCWDQNEITDDGGLCNGMGCCQTTIPAGLDDFNIQWGYDNNSGYSSNPCLYAVLVEEDWYKFQVQDLRGDNFYNRTNEGRVPLVLDWAIRDNGTCQEGTENNLNPACLSYHSSCYNTSNGKGYLCQCLAGFEGNPYIKDGCLDIDECKFPDKYPCHGYCTNTEGSYECSCSKGTIGNATIGNCTKIPEKFPYPARVAIASILGIAAFFGLCFLVATHQQHKKHKKEKEEYNRYYQMMDNHLRVFSEKQIEIATDNYSDALVLGAGGQGNVYQGLLENNEVVAIKKAKEVEETQRGEFVNEIILLSQINHKNIVRLLGCCLEVKIPMLVYEFVPNGTLFDFLHRNSSRRLIPLGTRLKIALDSAVALDHLHSSIFRSIIHGDVKSANILLDADYTAKVSDFGASSIVTVNENIEIVHFTHGYLDPECLYTQIITKKSDVYSFGVVMLELLTRKEAVYIDEKGEKQPLATSFLSKSRKNEHRVMLDVEIVNNDENVVKVLDDTCEIALQCLSPNGEDRPTMGNVVEELQKVVRFHNSSPGLQIDQEEMENLVGERKFPSISDASGFNSTQYSAVFEISTGGPR